MPDEQVDTPDESVETDQTSQEPTETEQQQTQEQTPAYITAEQLLAELDKRDQSQRSWLGRRDKELTNYITNVIEERLKSQPSMSVEQMAEEFSQKLHENPRKVIRAEIEAMTSEQQRFHQKQLSSTLTIIGNSMESDPLYDDKTLGNEVVDDIKEQVQQGKFDPRLNPEQSGKIMLGNALANVIRKRSRQKVNPLAKNKPGSGSKTLSPPAKTDRPRTKVAALDDQTRRMAKHWGYDEESLAKLFPAENK